MLQKVKGRSEELRDTPKVTQLSSRQIEKKYVNYKMLMEETKEHLRKWRNILCSWRGTQYSKTRVLPKLMHRFEAILTKIPQDFFVATEKNFLKLIWKGKGTRIG